MKKWKRIYDSFKLSSILDEQDLIFIELSEKMLKSNKLICKKIVYSELWLSNWIKTTQYRVFVQQCIGTLKNSNVEIY